MNLKEIKINFTNVRSMVEAAAHLQDAGEQDKAWEVMHTLALKVAEDKP